jgi:hypothetical protein
MSATLEVVCVESCKTALHTAVVPASIRTSLFEVVSALQDVAGPDDDAVVVAGVADLLQSGRIRFLNEVTESY